jgi:hypothetical protein
MKPLRTEDESTRPDFDPAEPDFSGLRRILVGFVLVVGICAGVCGAMIIRDARQHHARPEAHVRCMCMGRCLRASEQ